MSTVFFMIWGSKFRALGLKFHPSRCGGFSGKLVYQLSDPNSDFIGDIPAQIPTGMSSWEHEELVVTIYLILWTNVSVDFSVHISAELI